MKKIILAGVCALVLGLPAAVQSEERVRVDVPWGAVSFSLTEFAGCFLCKDIDVQFFREDGTKCGRVGLTVIAQEPGLGDTPIAGVTAPVDCLN